MSLWAWGSMGYELELFSWCIRFCCFYICHWQSVMSMICCLIGWLSHTLCIQKWKRMTVKIAGSWPMTDHGIHWVGDLYITAHCNCFHSRHLWNWIVSPWDHLFFTQSIGPQSISVLFCEWPVSFPQQFLVVIQKLQDCSMLNGQNVNSLLRYSSPIQFCCIAAATLWSLQNKQGDQQ